MNHKKRNSILRTSSKEVDQTSDFNVRLKRRISFSEKKSIRVFCNEEEPKMWDNSYELSDRAESTNNSNCKSGNSSDIQAQSTSALCTTSEYIEKSNQGEIFIENSLGITLLEYELKNIKKGPINPVKKPESKINSTVKPSPETNTARNGLEAANITLAQPSSTTAAMNFEYLNENSNKENIEPETWEVLDINNTKKTKPTEEILPPTDMDLDTSTINLHSFEIIKKYSLSSTTNIKQENVTNVEKAKTALKRKKILKTKNENTKKMKSKFW